MTTRPFRSTRIYYVLNILVFSKEDQIRISYSYAYINLLVQPEIVVSPTESNDSSKKFKLNQTTVNFKSAMNFLLIYDQFRFLYA